MIIYVCNRCREHVSKKKDVICIQTKIGEDSSIAHLCKSCYDHIKCVLSEDAKKRIKTALAEDAKSRQSDGAAIMQNMLKHNEDSTKEVSRKSTINVDTFNDEMDGTPRNSTVPSYQRILLAIYRGDNLQKIADLIGKNYAEVYRVKTKFGCKRIARKHLEDERYSETVNTVIDTYIRCGDVEEVCARTKVSEDDVNNILSEYTGLYRATDNTDAKEVIKEKKTLNVNSFKDSITRTPRTASIRTVQRALLCLYRGDTNADTSRIIGMTFQDVYRMKSSYGCKQIAMKHLSPERKDFEVSAVIESFIKYGDVSKVAKELSLAESKVEYILYEYTGLSK